MNSPIKDKTTEELEHIVTDSRNPVKRVEALLELSHRTALKDLLRSWLLAREAERDAEELENETLLAKANVYAGNALWKLGDYEAAQKHYMIANELYEKLNDHNGLSQSLMGLGIVHGSLTNFSLAQKYFEQALAESDLSGNITSAANAIGNIGSVHQQLNNHAKAEAFFHKALEMHEQMNDKPGIANMLNGLAGVKVYNSKFDEAKDYLNRFFELVTALENNHGIATALMNYGILHYKKGDYRQAIDYLEKALLHAESKKVRSVKINIHKHLGFVYTDMGKSQKAIEHHKHYCEIMEEAKATEIREKSELFERMKNAITDSGKNVA
jgi:tetratricopeptide (TPR) repeat protein